MYLDLGQDFIFGGGERYPKKKRSTDADGKDYVNPLQRKAQRQLEFAAFYREQNERLRKPCPCCSTLVRPALLRQHYDAYHPDVAFPSA